MALVYSGATGVMMVFIMAINHLPRLQFGTRRLTTESGKTSTTMYADVPADIFRRAMLEFRHSEFNAIKRTKAVSVINAKEAMPRIYFNAAGLARSVGAKLVEERARNIVRIVNLLDSSTLPHEKDPLVQVKMGLRPKPNVAETLFSMVVRLTLPKDLDTKAATIGATSHMRAIAEAMEYIPSSSAFGVVHGHDRPIAVLLDTNPVQGLRGGIWQPATAGSIGSTFTDERIVSYGQEVLCLGGVLGLVQATRDLQDGSQL